MAKATKKHAIPNPFSELLASTESTGTSFSDLADGDYFRFRIAMERGIDEVIQKNGNDRFQRITPIPEEGSTRAPDDMDTDSHYRVIKATNPRPPPNHAYRRLHEIGFGNPLSH